MLMGLNGIGLHYSYGDISKRQVKEIAEIASIHGFTLANYKAHASL